MKLYSLKRIETPRLLIRPVLLDDAAPLNQLINDSLLLLQQWMSWANDPSMEKSIKDIKQGVSAWKSGNVTPLPMVIISKGNQKIIGATGFNEGSIISQGIYELGYWLGIEYQGHGFGTEAINALAKYALNELDAKSVVIHTDINNIKSVAIPQRLHFNCKGTERDQLKPDTLNYIFICNNSNTLPPLEVEWTNHE